MRGSAMIVKCRRVGQNRIVDETEHYQKLKNKQSHLTPDTVIRFKDILFKFLDLWRVTGDKWIRKVFLLSLINIQFFSF